MKKRYAVYYYNGVKKSGNDLGLKLYADGFEKENEAYNYMEDNVSDSTAKYIILPYYFKEDLRPIDIF